MSRVPTFYGLVTARGGSKGIPGKNVRDLAGKPLIAWTLEEARKSQRLSRLIVSTDDPEIARVCRQWGGEVPFVRPAELAQDDTPHLVVVEHAIQWLRDRGQMPDYLLTLQPTCPLRTVEDIDRSIQLATTRNASAVMSVCEPPHHPLWTKQITEEGHLVPFIPWSGSLVRQLLPKVYTVNGVIHLHHCETLLRTRMMQPTDSVPYVMPAERSIDIDTPWEFRLAELILRDTQPVRRAA